MIWWSDEDKCFIAYAPDFGIGCKAHGDTKNEALNEIEIVISSFLNIYKELEKEIPKPTLFEQDN